MQTFEKWFQQDLTQPITVQHCESVMFNIDNLANLIGVRVYSSGSPADLGSTAVCTVIRSDGGTVSFSGTVEDNAITATLPGAALAVPGPIAVCLQTISGDTKMTVLKAVFTADQASTDAAVDPGTIIPSVTDLIDDIATAVASVPADYSDLLAAVAPTFSASTAYGAGSIVWYDGDLYQFTADHAAGSWTGTDAAAVTMGAAVGGMYADVDMLTTAMVKSVASKNMIDPNTLTVGRLKSDGTIQDTMTNYKTSDYILLEGGKSYIFAREKLATAEAALMDYSGYGFYDLTKTWVADSRVYDNFGAVTLSITPSSDCYVRVTGKSDLYTENTTALYILQKGTALDGYEAWFAPYTVVTAVTDDDVVQVTGQNADKVMSQKAVTDLIGGAGDVIGTASQINQFDTSLAEDGKYVNTSGSIASHADWAWTGKIPVKPNTQYNLSRDPDAPLSMVTAYYEWAADGSYIGATNSGYSYLMPIKTGATTAFVSVNMKATGHSTQDFEDTLATMMLCLGTARPADYAAYDAQPVLLAETLTSNYRNDPGAYDGLKWLAVGTSITWYDGKAYEAGLHTGEICRGYVGHVSRHLPLLVTNEGISGATIGNVSANSLINRYTTLDWAGSDIATIEFGVNDLGNNVPVGTASDAAGTASFAACLKTVIEYALGQNPQLRLIICTDPDVRGTSTNNNGNTLKDYSDVTLEIAAQYRLPVCDWYYHSGISALTKGDSTHDFLTADGTHPNDQGHARMGAMLLKTVEATV